ncbi:hypothetical protein [Pedobacter helvus]|uniref:Homeodomain phBC6A51-type domain-containing protein n=1 Tax=Pedobacter helvus TaxID=2563444 RepID=A0ABW9JG18_9SPHI|nr:hypothetical protein [Pedobacter ureilyticus]
MIVVRDKSNPTKFIRTHSDGMVDVYIMSEKQTQKHKLSLEEKLRRARKICELYSLGEYTIKSCCEVYSVKYSTFQYWAQPNRKPDSKRRGFVQDVHELYKRACVENEINFRERLKEAVRIGLLKLARGIEYEEEETVYRFDSNGMPYVSSVRKTTKTILPNDNVLIFLANTVGAFNT